MLSWPRPPQEARYSACHFCDTLHHFSPVDEGIAARCIRCGALLYQNRPASLTRASAFSIAAVLMMVLVHVFPLIKMEAAGMSRELTLIGAAKSLIDEEAPILGISILIFTVATPLMLACGMIYVCLPLSIGRAAPGASLVAKWMYRSEPWNMVEVFLLGVLVSLLKLIKVADVHFGIGFWAFAGLMMFMAAAVAGIDREELWDRLEVAKP